MNIEIRKPCRIKEIFHKIHDRLENILFSIILKLPEHLIPPELMGWMDGYTTKRINQLKRQTIRQQWEHMYLEQYVYDYLNNFDLFQHFS